MNEIRCLDLFGGIGGFRLGLESASDRFKFVDYVEKDKHAVKSYNGIFGEQHEPRDATELKIEEIPDHEVLCAGFPCQSFSIAGERRGFEDTRGTMFFEIARIAKGKLPEILFLENVKGLLNHSDGATFRKILSTLDELGYDAEWQVLNSKYHGVPQNRERVFIIGHLRGESRPEIFPFRREAGENSGTNGRELKVVGNTVPSGHEAGNVYSDEGLAPTVRENHGKVAKVVAGLNTTSEGDSYTVDKNHHKGKSPSDFGEARKVVDDTYGFDDVRSYKNESPSIRKERQGLKVQTQKRVRKLTPRECWRLQGFPDWAFEAAREAGISDTQLYQQAGNAVTVDVIEDIAERLIELEVFN